VYHFDRFLIQNNNKDYLKEINYKLALTYLIKGDIQNYEKYKNRACTTGDETTERDRETIYDCRFNPLPNINLTKAKLLIQGGYIKRAGSILKQGISRNIPTVADSLEFYLLKAKLMEKEGNTAASSALYQKVTDKD